MSSLSCNSLLETAMDHENTTEGNNIDDQESIVQSDSDPSSSSQTLSEYLDDDFNDDVISLASSVLSTYHSSLRKQERKFSTALIKKIKKLGLYEKQRVCNKLLEIRWKVEYEGDVIILSEDFKTLITCYSEMNPAIPFYNDLCDRFDTCGKHFTKYDTKITLDEFREIIGERKILHKMNFETWPANKPLLIQTARNGRLDLMRYLIEECNYNPFVVGKQRYSILHYACYDGRFEMIEYIVKNDKLRTKLLDMKASNGETGLDALKNSDKLTDIVRNQCLTLFENVNFKADSESVVNSSKEIEEGKEELIIGQLEQEIDQLNIGTTIEK